MVNWDDVRKEWETTKITFKDLAEKHDVKLGTLKSRRSREEWSRDATEKKDATLKATQSKKDATKDKEITWIDIESEYVTDISRKPCTLKSLAKKHDIPFKTIEGYSHKNKWSEKREKHKGNIREKTAEKSAELISDDVAKVTLRHFRTSDKLLKVIESALDDEHEFYKYVEKLKNGDPEGGFNETIELETLDALNESKLLTVVNAADKIQKMQRQTLNIFDTKDLLAIEKSKAEVAKLKGDKKDTSMLEALVDGQKQFEELGKSGAFKQFEKGDSDD